MRFLLVYYHVALILLAHWVVAHRVLDHDDNWFPCGTNAIPERFLREVDPTAPAQTSASEFQDSDGTNTTSTVCKGCVILDLYFHVLEDANRTSSASALATDAMLISILAGVNADYASTPFQFNLVEVMRWTNDTWAFGRVLGRSLAQEINAVVRQGGADVLNVIISDGACIGDLGEDERQGGFASLPWLSLELFPNGTYDEIDYVYICPEALPSKTLTHELGVSMLLLHNAI